VARQDGGAVDCLRDLERGGPLEDVGKRADALGREVMDDKNGARKVGRQGFYQPKERLDAASGKAQHYDVANWHAPVPFSP
jgi:hypothetical protein